jgi:hypothetical protein
MISPSTEQSSGAEQATTIRKRGGRGNGRRIRRQLDRELTIRREVLDEDGAAPQPIAQLRARLGKIDRRIFQLKWEQLIGWTGEPGYGPAFDQNPKAAREFERWRGLLDGRSVGGYRRPNTNPSHGVGKELL